MQTRHRYIHAAASPGNFFCERGVNDFQNAQVSKSLPEGTSLRSWFHFFVLAGATGGAAGPAARLSFTDCGSLSAFATSKLTCHICVLDRVFPKPGIPVIRIPPATFQ